MKKLFFIAAFGLMSVAATQAQEIRLGAKGGVNFSNIGGDNNTGVDFKSRTGFHIGALVEIPVSERFWVQPEVLYTAQGSKTNEIKTLGSTVEDKVNLDYIQVPVMAKYYVVEGLSLEAGPQIAFLVKAEGETSIETPIGDGTITKDFDKDNFSSIDFSMGVGASYRLDMGLFLGARYNFGFTDINDGAYSDSKKLNNSVFQLSAGYSF